MWNRYQITTEALFAGLVLAAALGCGTRSDETSGANSSVTVLNGAGATFPSPVYANWCYLYSESTLGRVLVNYQGIGSGAGITQLKEGTIDFAGTDAPLTAEELERGQLIQFPMLAGGIVVIVHLPGIADGELKLSREALAAIFLGKITRWDDPLLAAAHPDLALPPLDITVVHRSDGSGTTFLFTRYLSQISPEWRETVGEGKSVRWPVGVAGQKNPGVCNNVAHIDGAIGYTEYTYAAEAHLATAALENSAGRFIPAGPDSFAAALEQAEWSRPDVLLTDAPGDESYPLLGITYLLYRQNLDNTKKAELTRYFDWCFQSGQNAAKKMHYLPVGSMEN